MTVSNKLSWLAFDILFPANCATLRPETARNYDGAKAENYDDGVLTGSGPYKKK